MFRLWKLDELSPRVRQRKIARILQGIEVDAAAGISPDSAYLQEILPHLGTGGSMAVDEAAARLAAALRGIADGRNADAQPGGTPLLRAINGLRHALLADAHAEPAEWDMVDSTTGKLDRTGVPLLPMAAYLEDVRSPFNVGSIFRTAEAFGASRLLLSPRTASPDHPRAAKTSLGATTVLQWERAELDAVSAKPGVFALELGGVPTDRFPFPDDGIVLVGSEELGLSPEALSIADRAGGRVSIPLVGAKHSLNVSVAFGILMEAWRRALTTKGR